MKAQTFVFKIHMINSKKIHITFSQNVIYLQNT